MPARRLPVRPDLTQLRNQAKDLLRAIRAGDTNALAEFTEHHPAPPTPASAKLSDAQLALARSYQASSWTRLVHAVELVEAIWSDDAVTVERLIRANTALLHEEVLIRNDSNWGPPLTYAANLGRDRLIRLLHRLGATDLRTAMGRAVLQGHIGTARMLHDMLGRPLPPAGALGGPAYTLSVEGTALVFALGGRAVDDDGTLRAPVDVVLETDGRNAEAKHAILRMYEEHGVRFPDSAPMALHRGRLDLLEQHLHRDPSLLTRTFTHREIYPAEMG
jgi:hypothetical protein